MRCLAICLGFGQADGAGAIAGKNKGNPFKATKGVMKGMAGAAAINSAMASGAGQARSAPAVAGAAMQHPDKLAAASKAAADFASGVFDKGPAPMTRAGVAGAVSRAGYDWYEEKFGR